MPIQVINVVEPFAPTADGTTEYQLQPLPLCGLIVSVWASATAANTAPNQNTLADMLPAVEVALAGTNLYQANGRDALALHASILGSPPTWIANGNADNDLAQLRFIIPFSRRLDDPRYGLPKTQAGQLRLRLQADIANGGYDTLTWTVDAIHRTETQTSGFLRSTTLARTASATGDLDIQLPIGRPLSQIIAFSTTEKVTEAGARGIASAQILKDSVEVAYPSVQWETMQALLNLRCPGLQAAQLHTHPSDIAAAYTQFQLTRGQIQTSGVGYSHGLIDFDPLGDQSEMLDTSGCALLTCRVNMATAEALRLCPVEFWPVNQPLAGMQ